MTPPEAPGRPWPLPVVLGGLAIVMAAAGAIAVFVLVVFGTRAGPDPVVDPVGPGDSVGQESTRPVATPIPDGGVAVEPMVEGLERPVGFAMTDGPSSGIFVAQQNGLVVYVEDGEVQDEPVLDLTDVTLFGGEQGMLGIALHPDFAENRRLFVAYSHQEPATILAEYAAPDGIHADPATERILLRLPQESNYHKGGALVFGPDDGLLYMSIGDDAWPRGTTPDYTDSLRGTIIRIDIDEQSGDLPYGIPDGNAFADGDGPPEVFDYGLRNPWRMSIDPESGDLYIADVGSERFEEVSRHRAGVPAGLDFGWGAWEGFECRRHQIRAELDCDEWADAEPPILVIEGGEFRSGDCAIIGGYVYHGAGVPALQGKYVFGDYCSGRLRTIPTDEEAPTPEIVLDTEIRMSSFAVDSEGELYIADVDNGVLYRVVSD
jgi:glucose/arabinose dehydrogenase